MPQIAYDYPKARRRGYMLITEAVAEWWRDLDFMRKPDNRRATFAAVDMFSAYGPVEVHEWETDGGAVL